MSRKIKKILVTAGPTREMLDPVRFISNLSTGHMGYAIAEQAAKQGYQVTLVTGPTALKPPLRVKTISITSTSDLQKTCQKLFPKHDALIMSAAVCDFTAKSKKGQKITRSKGMQVQLKQTPDIVAGLAKKKKDRCVIGFCLETQDWLGKAKTKIRRKHLDGIVANYYNTRHVPFGDRRINTAFLSRQGELKHLKQRSKKQIARQLLGWMESLSPEQK